MSPLYQTLLVAAGSALGGSARFWLVRGVHDLFSPSEVPSLPGFPIGVLVVNLTGALLAGLLSVWLLTRTDILGDQARLLLAIGFLGSYTTFSALSVDTVLLLQGGAWRLALVNLLGSLLIGVVATVAGMLLGRVFWS